MDVPKFIKCKNHGQYCFIKTSTSVVSPHYKQSFFICSQDKNCTFKVPLRLEPVFCLRHPEELIELQAYYWFSADNIRHYYRCNVGRDNPEHKWCGFQLVVKKVDNVPLPSKVDKSCRKALYDITSKNESVIDVSPVMEPIVKTSSNVNENLRSDEQPGMCQSNHQQSVRNGEINSGCQTGRLFVLQRNLEMQKKLLTTLKVSSLPDNGMKLQNKIAELEQEINNLKLSRNVDDSTLHAKSSDKPNTISLPSAEYARTVPADRPAYPYFYARNKGASRMAELRSVSQEAVEKLHKAIATKPKETDEVEGPKNLKVALMIHQRQALAWLLWRESQNPPGGILADEMGLGKTLTVLALILKDKEIHEENQEKKSKDVDASTATVDQSVFVSSNATLIVCPTSLLHHWESEIQRRFSPGCISHIVYHGPKRKKNLLSLATYDIVITTYGVIDSEISDLSEESSDQKKEKSFEATTTPLSIRFRRVVLDEGHIIKNPKTNTCKAVCRLKSESRWIVTGTPIQNRLTDMFSLLKFLKCSPFDDHNIWKACLDNGSVEGKARLAPIVNTLILRRTKDKTGTDGKPLLSLPQKMLEDFYLNLNEDEKAVYDMINDVTRKIFKTYMNKNAMPSTKVGSSNERGDDVLQNAFPGVALKANVNVRTSMATLFALLLRLRQCCCHLSLLENAVELNEIDGVDPLDDISKQLESLNLKGEATASSEPAAADVAKDLITSSRQKLKSSFRKSHCSSKITALLNKLKELQAISDSTAPFKSVIVSQWTSFLDVVGIHLNSENIKYCSIRGDVPVLERSKAVEEFNSPTSGPQVMLLSLQAGGVGLNLIGGNYLFLLDVHWNPALESQAYDRIHRVGQKRDVHIYRFICKDTVETRIVALQERKKDLARDVLDGQRRKTQALSLQDLRSLFGM